MRTSFPPSHLGAGFPMIRLTRKLQILLSGSVGVLFCVAIAAAWIAETGRALRAASDLAEKQIRILGLSVKATMDRSILETAHLVANAVGSAEALDSAGLVPYLGLFDVSEIHVIDTNGVIRASTVPEDEGWKMAAGEQSAEFLRLLRGESDYAQPPQPKSNGGAIVRYAGVAFPGGGFLQVALDEDTFRRTLRRHLASVTEHVHIQRYGFVVLFDTDGTVLSVPVSLSPFIGRPAEEIVGLSAATLAANGGHLFRFTANGEASYGYAEDLDGFLALVVQPTWEVFAARSALMPVFFAAEVPLFLVFFLLVSSLLRRFVTDDIQRFDDALGRIAAGDYGGEVAVRSCVEFSSLTDNINAAATALRRHSAAEREGLRRERDAAIETEKASRLFFATVSHDIRTPLNSILGFTQLLRAGGVDGKTSRRYLDGIAESGEVLLQLINDVLNLSRLQSDKMVFSPEWCDVRALVEGTVGAFMPRADENGIALGADLPPDLPQIRVDPHRLRQILFNLLGNAVKFTPKGSVRVEVRWTPGGPDDAGGTFEAAVRDTGIGIAPENLAQLGRPFVQLSAAKGIQGSGLGLAICRQMLARMGGELRMESEPGKGSVFTVVLRGVASRAARTAEESRPDPSADGAAFDPVWRETPVLLVDDMKVNLLVLASLCRHLGLRRVATCASGAEALEFLRRERTALVLTDLWMPGMDGVALAAAIRADPALRGTLVCAVTADVEIRKTSRALGFVGLLLKPILLENLGALLASLPRPAAS